MKHSLKTFSLIFLLFFCLGKPAVAQQIDLNSLNAFWKIFEELLLNKPDSIVMQLDSSMQLMAQSKGVKFKTVKDYRNLFNYTSGHSPGYYMADIIVRNGYSKELIENVQNPFYFITLYNKAAKKDKQHPPVFSDEAIDFSKDLARKYWKTGG